MNRVNERVLLVELSNETLPVGLIVIDTIPARMSNVANVPRVGIRADWQVHQNFNSFMSNNIKTYKLKECFRKTYLFTFLLVGIEPAGLSLHVPVELIFSGGCECNIPTIPVILGRALNSVLGIEQEPFLSET